MATNINDVLSESIAAWSTPSASGGDKKPVKTLGKDDFLQLFITQLVHQNPMEPLDNDQFISQMAQFTAIEQATNTSQNMAKLLEAQQENNELMMMLLATQGNPISMQMYEGASLIGHKVTAQTKEGSPMQGYVTGVTVSDGLVKIHLDNGMSYQVSEVIEISA